MSPVFHLTWNANIKWWKQMMIYLVLPCILNNYCHAWLPDTATKLINNIDDINNIKFIGNASHPDHFTVLNQDANWIVLGARNTVYNLSTHDFSESKEGRLTWISSEAHSQLCQLKGKSEDDCQNYIRILVPLTPRVLLVCGTNSYKPLCRRYILHNNRYRLEKEFDGIGVCPYNPEHNNTAVQSNGQIFAATIADFSERDPVIYREPQRTELSDLKQLNAPNFVSSMQYGDYIFFFFRETAVEYINCGKIIYSRVARVCKDDKGGPHQFGDKWTSFLKARLNCSLPGEYPFYFDEIQATSEIVEGKYGSKHSHKIIYGTLTTPNNAIGGSAICAYSMHDILRVFEGTFKQQESMNSNWLPVPEKKIPEPRPGQCVKDSRILPENVVNFVKTHSLMEEAVPALFGQPILVRVSLQYRFTAIAVDPQVQTVNDERFDILYVGTDNGQVLKIVNIPTVTGAKAVVVSENNVFSNGTPIKELRIAPGYGRVIVVSRDEVKLASFNHCSSVERCQDCVLLQDPHCAWDTKNAACVSLDAVSTLKRSLIQDVANGDGRKCWAPPTDNKKIPVKPYNKDDSENEIVAEEEEITDPLLKSGNNADDVECEDGLTGNIIRECAVRQHLVIYTAKTLQIIVICSSLVALLFGFIAGYVFSRKFHSQTHYPDAPYIEQHNHLDRLSGNPNGFLTPRANKAVNLVVNVPPSPPPKKDNLETSKDLNIASDGTLQKIKKTYI